MFFRMIYDDKLAQAAYLIGCQRTKEAIVIDPQRDVERYIEVARENGLRITAVTETHIHADFLSGTREMAERCGATIYLSDEGDADWKYGWVGDDCGYDYRLVTGGDTIEIGGVTLTVRHTPGHTPEHICFLVTDRGGEATEPMGIATGDFVFVGDLGRPDLLESAAGHADTAEPSARRLFQSARALADLPDYLQLWPGHGAGSACGKSLGAVPQSTVGYERRFNPALQCMDDEERFVASILHGQPEPPLYFARMKRQNRDGPPVLGAPPVPRSLDPVHLADLDARRVAVVDTRPWDAFRSGHLEGALHAPLTNAFPTVTGSYIEEGAEIHLIVEDCRVAEAVRDLIHVGLDRVTGYASPQTLETFAAKGGQLVSNREIDARTLIQRCEDADPFVLDVRRSTEYAAGHVPGSYNIAHTRLLDRLKELPQDQPLLVHCRSGVRSAFATALLQKHGFGATNVAGGFLAWQEAGGEIAHEDAVTA